MNVDKLLIGGDLYMPSKYDYKAMDNILDESVLKLFHQSDWNIVNLEAPICENISEYKIIKSGPNLINDGFAVDILKQLKVNLLTLANNHILDFGEYGIRQTLKLLDKNEFDTVGAGTSFKEASKIYYKQLKYNRIAIVNVAENEWASAENEKGGANPYNLIENVRSIKEAKTKADIVILIIHGGHEQYSLPSPRMKEVYRFFIEQGADAVVGHHPHCYSGYEVYQGAPIFYSLGNFIFPWENEIDSWYEGMVVEILCDENHTISFNLHPYNQCKNKIELSLMSGEKMSIFNDNITKLNSTIEDSRLLKAKWDEYLDSINRYNLSLFSLANIFPNKKIRNGLRKLGLSSIFLPKKYLVRILNQIRCESHLETSIGTLKKYLKL